MLLILIPIFLIIFLPPILSPILLLIFLRKKEYVKLDQEQKYAGFWHRFLAGIIDLILLYIVSFAIGFFIGYNFLMYTDNDTYYLFMEWISNLLGIFISYLYFVFFQSSSKQATLGMMIVGIKIYDEHLQRVGFWRLTGRYFTTGISNLILCIGFFMIGWTQRKQGLHDIISRTIHLKT